MGAVHSMTMNNQKNIEYAEILRLIGQAERVLLCTHLAPDGDALGSMLALGSLVKRMGKQVTMICHDPVPGYLVFLPGQQAIKLPAQAAQEHFDLAISVDASGAERLGDSHALFAKCPVTIQMDHHQTNTRFAQHNLVLAQLPASGSVVFPLFEAAGLPITREEAIYLYTAISTDTGNFCFGHISDVTFEQVAATMRAGLPLVETARQLHLMREKEQVLMLGRALNSLKFFMDGRLSGMEITQQDYLDCGATDEHTDKIVNHGLYIPGVQMCYLANETQDGIKFSLRSIAPYRVSDIAFRLGGGGHNQAAGCTIHKPLAEAVQIVRQAMESELSS